MKKMQSVIVSLIAVFILVLLCNSALCTADVEVASTPRSAITSGSEIFYSNGMYGLYKYNLKTKKSNKVKSNVIRNGSFAQLSVKGDYIYFVAAANYIDADSDTFFRIYRMKKNGKSVKALAYGESPVIKGNWIYYIRHKRCVDTYDNSQYTISTGYIYKMKLDGSSQKKVGKAEDARTLFTYKNRVLYSKESFPKGVLYSVKGEKFDLSDKMRRSIQIGRELYSYGSSPVSVKLRAGNYLYYTKRTGSSAGNYAVNTIYRKPAKGGKEKAIYSSGSYKISSINLLSKHIIVGQYNGYTGQSDTVLLNLDGKKLGYLK